MRDDADTHTHTHAHADATETLLYTSMRMGAGMLCCVWIFISATQPFNAMAAATNKLFVRV